MGYMLEKIQYTVYIRSLSRNKNTESNDLKKMICLRKTEVCVERITVYKVIETLVEHGRQFQ